MPFTSFTHLHGAVGQVAGVALAVVGVLLSGHHNKDACNLRRDRPSAVHRPVDALFAGAGLAVQSARGLERQGGRAAIKLHAKLQLISQPDRICCQHEQHRSPMGTAWWPRSPPGSGRSSTHLQCAHRIRIRIRIAAPKQQQMQRQQVMPGLRALLVRPRVHLILQSRSLLHASNC